MVTCRSATRLWPPEAAVKARRKPGHQAMTSKMTSNRSTRGNMPPTRRRGLGVGLEVMTSVTDELEATVATASALAPVPSGT